MAILGGAAGGLLALVLGIIVFGIGMAQEEVYDLPWLWRGGVEDVEGGFEFVIVPNLLGILVVVLGGSLLGLLAGLRGRSRV